ncbi:isocitrate lyase/phosphoenolpyruvate mutase family protein [Candidatus Villigracilis affinis]|uniref:isocitrate lyase/PEP mutase family protein n=1 Tax=Candidatus Villigracilis affinis TaxID=3140682 RepID=UPI001DD360CB|nr:isocitrate lyase/phosphoenolpyruvate mutase family protein [Anaerolineales bacterium]
MSQAAKAQILLTLHNNGKLLILPNVWNPIGARMLESKSFPAVATASAAIAESLGYSDGEQLKLDSMLDMIARIVRSVNVPVTADLEAGYSDSISGLQENISRLLDTGAVGINFEDSWDDSAHLRPIPEQVERIQAVRAVAEKRGIPLVINARADSFFAEGFSSLEDRIEDVITRANAYLKAGADCTYPIGASDKETLKVLRQRINAPINVLASAKTASLKELQEIGINRVSFGPYIFRSLLAKESAMYDEFNNLGSYDIVTNGIFTGSDVQKYLITGKE